MVGFAGNSMHLTRLVAGRLGGLRDEGGQALVITAIFLVVLVLIAAWVIDEAGWYTHHTHLQTEADAAALAAAQNFQLPCASPGTVGATSDSATTQMPDSNIINTIHEYDGTAGDGGGGPSAPPNYSGPGSTANTQVWSAPTPATSYSASDHNLFSLVNQPNFENQSAPGDAFTYNGDPCNDGNIDVKMTETNIPAIIPFLTPSYVNAQARVTFKQVSQTTGSEPFVQPLPTPSTMTAQLVNEATPPTTAPTSAVSPAITLSPTDSTDTTWTGTATNVGFTNSGPIGLIVNFNGSGTPLNCGTSSPCYETANEGVAYGDVWSNTGTPGQLNNGKIVPPQAGSATTGQDITVIPAPLGTSPAPCPAGPSGQFSNFVSSPIDPTTGQPLPCSIEVAAQNVVFSTGAGEPTVTCSNASLTITVGTNTPVSLPCPVSSGTPVNGQTWTSNPITVVPSSSPPTGELGFGPTNLVVKWKLTAGDTPGSNGSTTCSSTNACTGTLGSQRFNLGAYDSSTSQSSGSGPILGVNIADQNSNEIMSVQKGTTDSSVTVTVTVLGFQAKSTISASQRPLELTFGGNNANGATKCTNPQDTGSNYPTSILTGCQDPVQTVQLPYAPPSTNCADSTSTAPCFVQEQPGQGTLSGNHGLSDGMNLRVNGGSDLACLHPSYWAAGNSLYNINTASPTDPRLISMLITTNNGLTIGAGSVPILGFAEFYATGWADDPCVSSLPSTNPNPAEGTMTNDNDPPGDNGAKCGGNNANPACGVLMGYFVEYASLNPNSSGSGTCGQNPLEQCVGVLTR